VRWRADLQESVSEGVLGKGDAICLLPVRWGCSLQKARKEGRARGKKKQEKAEKLSFLYVLPSTFSGGCGQDNY